MGNSAGVLSSEFKTVDDLCASGYFQQPGHLSEYSDAMSEAIKSGALDVIEVLLVGGNSRLLDPSPMILAAQFNQLETLELLCSAGFDVDVKDSNGDTALHKCAASNKYGIGESGHCGAYLALQGGVRVLTIRNKNGETCFHIASQANNLHFMHSVLSVLNAKTMQKVLKMVDSSQGLSCRDMAKYKGHGDMVTLINQFLFDDGYGNSVYIAESKKYKKSKEVDPARLMAVWEKFFENAAKIMMADEMAYAGSGVMFDNEGYTEAANQVGRAIMPPSTAPSKYDDGYAGNYNNDGSLSSRSNKSRLNSARSGYGQYEGANYNDGSLSSRSIKGKLNSARDNSSKLNSARSGYDGGTLVDDNDAKYLDAYSNYDVSTARSHTSNKSSGGKKSARSIDFHTQEQEQEQEHHSYRNLHENETLEEAIQKWFYYTLVYTSDEGYDNYYIYDAYSGESIWLQDFINMHSGQDKPMLPNLDDPNDQYNAQMAPTNVSDMVKYGWLSYYDQTSNSTFWLNIHTWQCETHLAIASDPLISVTPLKSIVDATDSGDEYIAPDQCVCESWVLVLNNSTNGEEPTYYYNSMLGTTSWTPMANQAEIDEKRNGWQLVTSEEAQWSNYWYHPETLESRWQE